MQDIYKIKDKTELQRIGIILRGHQSKLMADIDRAVKKK